MVAASRGGLLLPGEAVLAGSQPQRDECADDRRTHRRTSGARTMSDVDDREAARKVVADPGDLSEEREEVVHLRSPCEAPRCPVCIRAAQRFFDRGAEIFLFRDWLEERGLRSPRVEAVIEELAKLAPRMRAILERFQRELSAS